MKLLSILKVVGRSTQSRALCSKATAAASQPKKPGIVPGPGGCVPDVAGLSSKVVDIPSEAVGPGASKNSAYKNPEYYCYNPFSYAEAEVEMIKFRLPQPSSRKTQ